MDLRSGHPYWVMKDGMPFEYGRLNNPIRTDVTIIGGGISGALLAYKLIESGISCVLVEAELIGMGSTCASTGLLQYELDVPLHKLKKMIGAENAETAYCLCRDAIRGIKDLCTLINYKSFTERKSLFFASTPGHKKRIEEEYQARKNAGLDVSLLYKNEIKNQFHFDAAAAILSGEAAEIDAYGFTHSLLQHSIRKGLKVYARTRIIKIIHQKNLINLTTDNACSIKSKFVIHATGYEAALQVNKDLFSIRSTFATCSEQADFTGKVWNGETLLWNTADPYFYQRTTHNNRIMIGGRDVDFYDPVKRDKLIERKTKLLVKDFHKLFPKIPFTPEFSWAGTFITTPDGMPYIGSYKNKNELYALGYGGNGITFSYIAADILSHTIQGKKHKHENLFSFDR